MGGRQVMAVVGSLLLTACAVWLYKEPDHAVALELHLYATKGARR